MTDVNQVRINELGPAELEVKAKASLTLLPGYRRHGKERRTRVRSRADVAEKVGRKKIQGAAEEEAQAEAAGQSRKRGEGSGSEGRRRMRPAAPAAAATSECGAKPLVKTEARRRRLPRQ